MFVPAARILTASCLLGAGITAVHGSATTPSSKPIGFPGRGHFGDRLRALNRA